MSTSTVALPLDRVRLDGDTQPRVELDRGRAEELAGLLRLGVELPPVIVFKDDEYRYWLASGFHRYHAHRLAGHQFVVANVLDGSLNEARLFAASTNKVSVLPRTTQDKMRAVHLVLTSPLAAGWDDNRVADHVQVPRALVAAVRAAGWRPPQDLWGEDDPDAAPPATPAARLATGGTLRVEDKPHLTEADRQVLRQQIARTVARLLRKAWFLDLDPVEVVREAVPAKPEKGGAVTTP